jgi:hypothetical protein
LAVRPHVHKIAWTSLASHGDAARTPPRGCDANHRRQSRTRCARGRRPASPCAGARGPRGRARERPEDGGRAAGRRGGARNRPGRASGAARRRRGRGRTGAARGSSAIRASYSFFPLRATRVLSLGREKPSDAKGRNERRVYPFGRTHFERQSFLRPCTLDTAHFLDHVLPTTCVSQSFCSIQTRFA